MSEQVTRVSYNPQAQQTNQRNASRSASNERPQAPVQERREEAEYRQEYEKTELIRSSVNDCKKRGEEMKKRRETSPAKDARSKIAQNMKSQKKGKKVQEIEQSYPAWKQKQVGRSPERASQIKDQGKKVRQMAKDVAIIQDKGEVRDFFPEMPEVTPAPSEKQSPRKGQYAMDNKRIKTINKEQKQRAQQLSPAKAKPATAAALMQKVSEGIATYVSPKKKIQDKVTQPEYTPSPAGKSSSQKKKKTAVRGFDARQSCEVSPIKMVNMSPEISLPKSAARESRIAANLQRNAEFEAKIAALQQQFNDRISQDHGSRMVKKHDAVYIDHDLENPVDGRYDDLFYSDMAGYYAHESKHDSPTKRLVMQKDATHHMKQANPDRKDTQLYLSDANLKSKKHA